MARIAPATPQIADQRCASATSTTKGDMFTLARPCAARRTLPTLICASTSSAVRQRPLDQPNCAMLSTTGNATPMNEPTWEYSSERDQDGPQNSAEIDAEPQSTA